MLKFKRPAPLLFTVRPWPKLRVAAATVLGGLALAASGYAATIVGTQHNDVLRGTAKADVIRGGAGNDKLYGRAGNDKLYGGPGNDLLVGGLGADLLNCGAGRDTAIADKHDTVASNCEVVKGLATTTTTAATTTTTTPPTTTTTPPTTTTTAPPPPAALAGRYCGFVDSGSSICFDISSINGGQVFTNAHFGTVAGCNPSAEFTITFDTTGSAPLKPDLSFDFSASSGDAAGSDINGILDTTGHAKGHFHLQYTFVYTDGTRYTCAGDTDWTAQIQT